MREVILLIDDTAAIHQLVKAQLSPHFEILSAYDGKTGLLAAAENKPDLVLLDIEMPGMQGYEVCRQLKEDRITRAIPVVFLSAARSVNARVRGLDAGACDYITKPFQPEDLRARLRAALRTHRALEEMMNNTMIDEMTSLFDRKYFETQLDAELATARRTGRPIGCILVDIDHMRAVNGAFGREIGDQMLYAVSQCLSKTSRREDVLCRFAGDDFGVLVPDAKASTLRAYAERFRLAVRSAIVCDGRQVIRVTASLGVSLSSLADDISLVLATEEALHQAKQAGGDCIRFAQKNAGAKAAA